MRASLVALGDLLLAFGANPGIGLGLAHWLGVGPGGGGCFFILLAIAAAVGFMEVGHRLEVSP